MIIKKYVGKTESEATEEAKKELGQNIVVMNVRPVKKSGFFSFFQSQKIEVTVALEEEKEKFYKFVGNDLKHEREFFIYTRWTGYPVY